MSSYLWKYFLEDDVDRFRHLLETAGYSVRNNAHKGGWKDTNTNMSMSVGMAAGSPGAVQLGTSPTMTSKSRKGSTWGLLGTPQNAPVATLTRADINWRDSNGMTLLHHTVSSASESSILFAQALIEHPLTDLYLQDTENGWTALHRAFYFGNITVARAIMERDTSDALGQGKSGVVQNAGGLIKIKDKEGHGPLDLFTVTIKDRTLRPEAVGTRRRGSDAGSEDDNVQEERGENGEERRSGVSITTINVAGDEVYTFGSNKNITLGFGDEDDRQYPERITLKRPDHLLQRFYREHVEEQERKWSSYDSVVPETNHSNYPRSLPVEALPWNIRSKPVVVQDVFMSKLHTAVLTTDPESNLYMCGHGPGGRLGLGHERSQFNFVCIEGGALTGKKIATVALGHNHTLALSQEGEIYSWGSNGFGQLGYSLPKTGLKDDEPINTVPRQIFGPLKREIVIGAAASRIHSVVHTASSLYTFGKNEGQLGIIDSDARSLDIQVTPRKVAASLFASPITSVVAIDKATVCLLENHDVWVFANYGYTKVQFDLYGTTNPLFKESFRLTRYETTVNQISKITAGGDIICAMSNNGQVHTLSVSLNRPDAQSTNTSTTNPTKIRGALSPPQRIWDPRKTNMAARDVAIDADGSIIISTEEGSVWKRSRRAKIKDSASFGQKQKDFKFSRVSGLTRVLAVRASAYGAYAAVRRDCDVTKTQVLAVDQTIWGDLFPLLCIHDLPINEEEENSDTEEPQPRFWQGRKKPSELDQLLKQLLECKDPEKELEDHLIGADMDESAGYDVMVCTTISDKLQFPAHECVLVGRSRAMLKGFQTLRSGGVFTIPDLLTCEKDSRGRLVLTFQGLDILTLVDFLLYCYTDTLVDFWHHTRRSPSLAFRYRQIRTELMKVATKLELHSLESAVRQMVVPGRSLPMDMEVTIKDPGYFANGDIRVQLADGEILVHSALVCRRCPFFEGLFMGRAAGRWLDERRGTLQDTDAVDVDLKHIESSIFKMVVRHIYADTGEELFDEVVSADLDEFLDLVMEVMSVANELMLDRLSQICQKVIGRFVTTRNVCGLLNAIAPSSVTEFKDASLEYMCLGLEAMLQGGLLDELDEDLLLELDSVVQDNQLACLPIARSGRAEQDILERHPELLDLIDRERRAKIDSIVLHSKYQDLDSWGPSSFRGQSLEENLASPSPSHQKQQRKSSRGAGGLSPYLRGRNAVQDLGASIEEDVSLDLGQPAVKAPGSDYEGGLRADTAVGTPTDTWLDSRGKPLSPAIKPRSPFVGTPVDEKLDLKDPWPAPATGTPASSSKTAPWGATPSPGAKLEMRDIMAQTSTSRVSNLSLGIAASRAQESAAAAPAVSKPSVPGTFKMSQKERKKIQLAQQEQAAQADMNAAIKSASPWQTVQKGPTLKDIMGKESQQSSRSASPKPPTPQPTVGRTSTTPHLNMRQTIANPKTSAEPKNIGPSNQSSANQKRAVSGPVSISQTSPLPLRPAASPTTQTRPPSTSKRPSKQHPQTIADALAPSPPPDLSSQSFPNLIQSIRHQPKPVEASLQLSMSEILSQQQLEKDIIRETREAKRNLQDIQAEQEFQEWWDKETQRVKEEEEMARLIAEGKDPFKGRGGSGGSGHRGGKRGGKGGQGGRGGKSGQNAKGSGGAGGASKGRGGSTATAAGAATSRSKTEA